MVRRVAGVTLLEVLVASLLTSVVVGALWPSFLTTSRNVRRIASLSQAVQDSVVLLETFGRDVEHMVYPRSMGAEPLRIASDAQSITFWVPRPKDDPAATTLRAQPVGWSLAAAKDGTLHPARDGRSIGSSAIESWSFSFMEAGSIRKAEAGKDMRGTNSGASIGGLGLGMGPGFVATDHIFIGERPAGAAVARATQFGGGPWAQPTPSPVPSASAGPSAATTGTAATPLTTRSAPVTLSVPVPSADPMAHAGPFLVFRFTLVDRDGARLTRGVVYDLINAHMVGHHSTGFPDPAWAMKLDGALPRFEVDPATGASRVRIAAPEAPW